MAPWLQLPRSLPTIQLQNRFLGALPRYQVHQEHAKSQPCLRLGPYSASRTPFAASQWFEECIPSETSTVLRKVSTAFFLCRTKKLFSSAYPSPVAAAHRLPHFRDRAYRFLLCQYVEFNRKSLGQAVIGLTWKKARKYSST